jgi:hypothetical protein
VDLFLPSHSAFLKDGLRIRRVAFKILDNQLRVPQIVVFVVRGLYDTLVASRPEVFTCYGMLHRRLGLTGICDYCNEIWGSRKRRCFLSSWKTLSF